MIAIAFRFLAGRYHATPWERHTNEGVVEWPPSPWRILRALVAASYRLEPRPSRSDLDALVRKLADPPVYQVPLGAVAHTRHYMPTDDKPKLIFDTFVAVGAGADDDSAELIVAWPEVELDARQRQLLDDMLFHLPYLGRSESWVEARAVEWTGEGNVCVSEDGSSKARERIRLKALVSEAAYQVWKDSASKAAKHPVLPQTTVEILEQDSARLQKDGWSDTPGTEWLIYGRPEELLSIKPSSRKAPLPEPTFARYAIRSSVLPLLTDAVAIAERFRVALVSHADGRGANAMAVFSGHNETGQPLIGNQHAYYLPADDDGDGRIDSLIVWAPAGFDAGACDALSSLSRVWGKDDHDLYVTLIGLGKPEEFGGSLGGTALAGPARIWESRTPFILPRHPKFRRGVWVDTPEDQLRRFLNELGLSPTRVEPIPATRIRGRQLEWFRFRRERTRGNGRKATHTGFGFRLYFEEAVSGPIAVGYGAHMGLGAFVAVS